MDLSCMNCMYFDNGYCRVFKEVLNEDRAQDCDHYEEKEE